MEPFTTILILMLVRLGIPIAVLILLSLVAWRYQLRHPR
jgi:hypothetical protein